MPLSFNLEDEMEIIINKTNIVLEDGKKKKMITMTVDGLPFPEAIKAGTKGSEIIGFLEMAKYDLLLFMTLDNN